MTKEKITIKKSLKIYYAHAKCIYGTKHEEKERNKINKMFLSAKIIDPSSYENIDEKRERGMDFCLELVEKSDLLIFTRLLGKITSGVGKEINHALSKRIPVFELQENKFLKILKPVKYVTIEKTFSLYTEWEAKNLF